MKSIDKWLEEYGVSHQNKTNKLIHWICVPVIFFSVYGLISAIPASFLQDLFPKNVAAFIHFGNIGLIFVLGFYMRLSFKLFIGMLLYSILCVFVVTVITAQMSTPLWLISLIVFAAGWIGQFIGHHIEGAKPSFFII